MKRLLTAPFRALAWPFAIILHGIVRVLQLATDHTRTSYGHQKPKNRYGSDGEIYFARFIMFLVAVAVVIAVATSFFYAPFETMVGFAVLLGSVIAWFIFTEGRKAREETRNRP